MRELVRSVCFAVAVALLTSGSAVADPSKLAPGDPFPVLETDSISGTHVVLPADSHGAPFIAIFGFSRKAGEAGAQWSHAFYKALPTGVQIYAVADLSRVPGLFRGFAIAGIKKEASPTQPEHRDHVLLLTGKNDWSQIVPRGTDDDAVIVEVDRNGKVTKIVRLAYDDGAADNLAKAAPLP